LYLLICGIEFFGLALAAENEPTIRRLLLMLLSPGLNGGIDCAGTTWFAGPRRLGGFCGGDYISECGVLFCDFSFCWPIYSLAATLRETE